jgi:hypothetical protein
MILAAFDGMQARLALKNWNIMTLIPKEIFASFSVKR